VHEREPEHGGDPVARNCLDGSPVPFGGSLEHLERSTSHTAEGFWIDRPSSFGSYVEPDENSRHRLAHVVNDSFVNRLRDTPLSGVLAMRVVAGGQIESRILVENRLMKLTQRPGWLDAELFDQKSARHLICLERLGLPAGAIERQ
jgi:hypothetical protein